jgi:hypothetical protein
MYDDEVNAKLMAEQKAQRDYNQCGTQAPGQGIGYGGRPKTTEEKLSDIFSYHDDPSATPRHKAIRSTAKHFAEVIIENSPAGQDQSLALLYLRQAVMFANAAIALNGRTL